MKLTTRAYFAILVAAAIFLPCIRATLSCKASSCGPPPASPKKHLCPDKKTVAGPGPCSYNNATKKCGYPIISCPKCKKNADCKGHGLYCSTEGLCRASATCASNQDCVNPNNDYALTMIAQLDCVLCLTCNKGHCGTTCTPCSKVCPSNTNSTTCKPCSRVNHCLQCESTCGM